KGYRKWRRVANDLGQDTDHIMKVWRCSQATVPPSGKYRSIQSGIARLVLHMETIDHCRSHSIQAGDNQRIKNVIKRIPVRRASHDCTRRTALVVVVDYLR